MPATYAISSWLFLRALGLVYLVAFWSLGVQVRGLMGARGILPAADFLAGVARVADARGLGLLDRVLAVPTLGWVTVSDGGLVAMCAAGAGLGACVAAGICAAGALPLLWVLYLSLQVLGREFLAFQWDTLLLETGALAMVLAPWRVVHRPTAWEPPPLARWLVWWLLFRLMFSAGLVKLTSGDPLWSGLTALTVHYETQPLPTPLGWLAHQLPAFVQQACTGAMFVIELLVPWFILAGRRARVAACLLFVGLQLLIAATGNYGFFNLLTSALALTLLDDHSWPLRRLLTRHEAARGGPTVSAPSGQPTQAVAPGRWRGGWVPATLVALATVPVSASVLLQQAGVPGPRLALQAWSSRLQPFRLVNAYGLFAVMTPTRPEITIEGSRDGVSWHAYAFRHKPGDERRAPPWVAPHQPRLDWLMWFAALDEADAIPWFRRLCDRLLEGTPEVQRLFLRVPFGSEPPRFVRAVRSTYRMTTLSERRATGAWWRSGPTQAYFTCAADGPV